MARLTVVRLPKLLTYLSRLRQDGEIAAALRARGELVHYVRAVDMLMGHVTQLSRGLATGDVGPDLGFSLSDEELSDVLGGRR